MSHYALSGGSCSGCLCAWRSLQAEPLIEVAAERPDELARFAWHIGNRHIEMQVVGDRLRIRRDHVLEEMLRGLGARLTAIEAPFDPERGAYGRGHGENHGR